MSTEADRTFWSSLGSIFDFTLKFEEIVFGISLSSTFIILSIFFLVRFSLRPLYVGRGALLFSKLALSAALVGIRIALVICAALAGDYATDTSTPAGAIDLLAALFVVAWIYLEHGRSFRSSAFFTIYLFASVLADITRSRSFFLRRNLAVRGGLESAAASLQLGLLCLQEVSKRPDILDANIRENLGSEATSGPVSRLLFLFLRPIFKIGFREELVLKDLNELDPEFSPTRLYRRIKASWRLRQTIKPRRSRELAKTCLNAWKSCATPLVIARLVVTALNFTQPFYLRQVIALVGHQDHGPHDMGKRGGLFGASFLIFYGLPLARTVFGHLMNRYITRVRGGLTSLLFDKVHRLPQKEAKKLAAVTLMTADMDGITTGIPQCLDIPFGVVELGLGIYVLSIFVELSALVVFAPVAVTSIMTYIIGHFMGKRFAAWNKSIEQRVARTAHILPQLTAIKMLGLGPAVGAFLKHLRVEEVLVSRSYRRFEAISIIPVLVADLMMPAVVIAAALFGDAFQGQMAADKVFPTLTVISLIQRPLATVLHAYPTITGMLACFTRIEDFLRTPERKDPRVHLDLGTGSGVQSNSAASNTSLIRFEHADIAKSGMKEALLRGLNFQLPSGSTTAVVGRTGSGKSSLLDSILGESEVLAGTVKVDTSDVGYCSQNPWLIDDTIRNNIVGYEEYDDARFRRVIQACFLEEDLQWLPGGVEYVVGTNGCKLSGGQRQRVAIARTAYQQRKITLLDDVFSSLDRRTAIVILHQLCGRNGIFERAGCTVVLVTYLPDCLNVASNLLLLTASKQVILTPAAVRGTVFADEVAAILNESNVSTPAAFEEREQESIRRSLQAAPQPAQANPIDGSRRTGDREIYRPLLDLVGRLSAIRYAALLSMFSLGETLPEIYLRVWIELYPDDTLYFLGYVGIIFATCLLGSLCYWVLHAKLSPRSSIGLHSRLVDTTFGATLAFLSVTATGYLLNLYSQDMLLISRSLPSAIFRTIYAGAFVTAQIGVVLSGATYLSIILPFILVALYYIQRYYLRTSRQVRHIDLEMKSPLYIYFEETATGLSHIQASHWNKKNMDHGLALLADSQKPYYVMFAIQQVLSLVLGMVTGCIGVTLVGISLFVEQSSSETSVGLSFIGLLALARTLEVSIVSWTATETSSGALSRLLGFDNTTPQEAMTSTVDLPTRWPSAGFIDLRGVTARYRPQTNDDPALNNVTMRISPGARIGIAGRSGSGKSSLLMTFLGFIEYEGALEIDGIDIAGISRNELRSRLVTVTQDQVEFQGSIRMNLLPHTMNCVQAQSVEEAEKAALKDVELEDLLKSLRIWAQLISRGGLSAVLENVGYSKGELQLLCIARAIMKQRETGSKLVLIDEATSSVDSATEKVANRAMKENFAGCTILTIAHRRSSLRNVESVIEMYRGSIVGFEHLNADDEYLPDSTGSSN